LVAWLENFSPTRWAESWDNVGLLLGDPQQSLGRVMTCLTVTRETAAEAIREGAGLVVSHHPILFRPTQRVTAIERATALVWGLARASIAVYSPHTAFDNAPGGINEMLAARLGLSEVAPLRQVTPGGPATRYKVVVFCPAEVLGAVRGAACDAGAGRIGVYEECSFASPGEGTFRGMEGSNPTVGTSGRFERVAESRLELLCEAPRLSEALAAIRRAHSYEEPAIDVYPLAEDRHDHPGAGRVGTLGQSLRLDELAARCGKALGCSGRIDVVGSRERMVRRVAVACGAGDEFVSDAAKAGCDLLVTGEARFHRQLEASERGLGLILPGHYETERPGIEALAVNLAAAFGELTIWASRDERSPARARETNENTPEPRPGV
jgi:dinuclear metal center YbgI/SA1388 family protein